MSERNPAGRFDRRTLLKGALGLSVGAALSQASSGSSDEQIGAEVRGRSTAMLSPVERSHFIEQAQVIKSGFTLFDGTQPDFVPLSLPQPLVRFDGVNYVAKDDKGAYDYWRLLYFTRAKESGFDPLQIDGGGNDFNHSYHGAVSYAGAEGVAQFMPAKWRSSVDEIVSGGAEERGYFNWRQVPRLANLEAYRNVGANSVPPEMQEFVFLNAFTLTPGQWDPVHFALRGDYGSVGRWNVTNFINPANAV